MGYMKWLHTRWPAGTVEKLPRVNEDYSTNVPGLYIVGDLTGVPLLKFASDAGARTIQTIAADAAFQKERAGGDDGILDVAIIGAGVSGMAAAIEARKSDLSFTVIEASEAFSTIVNFPKGKPIFTYPTDMTPEGDLQFTAEVKEPLLEELREQSSGIELHSARVTSVRRKSGAFEVELAGDAENLRARRVIVAIGRSGNFRRLGVPGEKLDKVYNRLHDPKDFCGKPVMVVGGGDSAIEAAIALAQCGCDVALSYRKAEFSRPKPENVEKLQQLAANPSADVGIEEPSSERIGVASGPFLEGHRQPGSIRLLMSSHVVSIHEDTVVFKADDGEHEILNDAVFAMIGREPPLDFFRRSGVSINGETSWLGWAGVLAFLAMTIFVYGWKNYHPAAPFDTEFPNGVTQLITGFGEWWQQKVADRSSLIGTIAVSMKSRSFYYTLGYTLLIGIFGVIRIRRRRTPYVTVQTWCLFLIQLIPLFLLPEILFPYAGYHGWWESGIGQWFADSFMPLDQGASDNPALAGSGHPREYWRAYGFILAWPLMVYNVFSSTPQWPWLWLSLIQTFVLIPTLIYFYGKGAYCGWICSCGGLAETMGDAQRHKMPHGPIWNRLNMVGQVILAAAFVMLALRVFGWAYPDSYIAGQFDLWLSGKNADGGISLISWNWAVDIFLGGIIGVGFYFKYSGRVWCRFACPLAALMHIYARFSRFRIVADKKKCISCNVCTSVCHQGIDVMNFANKGMPMADPQCVRCSACVQSCPTGVLQFGRVDREGNTTAVDKLAASSVQISESREA